MRASMNQWFARTIATTLSFGFAVGSFATFASNVAAQGPLDRVADNANVDQGRYLGPLDRQVRVTGPSSTLPQADHGFSVLDLEPSGDRNIAKRLVRKSQIEIAPSQTIGSGLNGRLEMQTPISNAMAEAAQTILVSHQRPSATPVPATLASTEEFVERPQFEDEVISIDNQYSFSASTPFEQPRVAPDAFESQSSISSAPVVYPEAFQQEPISAAQRQQQLEASGSERMQFEGSFEDFQAMTNSDAMQSHVAEHHYDESYEEQAPQPTVEDYMAHGHIGYEDSPDAFSFGYQDGISFGFNNSRLYHPLEGPTTQLMGAPTVPSNFGQCAPRCNPWKSFCRGKDLDYICGGPGLKANPGHLGIPWLRSKDDCDLTEPLFGRCKTPFWKSKSGCGCGNCQ